MATQARGQMSKVGHAKNQKHPDKTHNSKRRGVCRHSARGVEYLEAGGLGENRGALMEEVRILLGCTVPKLPPKAKGPMKLKICDRLRGAKKLRCRGEALNQRKALSCGDRILSPTKDFRGTQRDGSLEFVPGLNSWQGA